MWSRGTNSAGVGPGVPEGFLGGDDVSIEPRQVARGGPGDGGGDGLRGQVFWSEGTACTKTSKAGPDQLC